MRAPAALRMRPSAEAWRKVTSPPHPEVPPKAASKGEGTARTEKCGWRGDGGGGDGLGSLPKRFKLEPGKPASEAGGDPSLPLRPVGAVLWAMVSDQVAKMVRADPKVLEALPPEQWHLGTHRVIVRVIAPMGGRGDGQRS